MKKAFCIVMTMLFLLVTSQQALVIVHFKLHQEAIEKQFCVNKNNPKLQCHGKCHLDKELKQTEKKDLGLTTIGQKIDMAFISKIDFFAIDPIIVKHFKKLIYREIAHLQPFLKIFVPPPNSAKNYPIT